MGAPACLALACSLGSVRSLLCRLGLVREGRGSARSASLDVLAVVRAWVPWMSHRLCPTMRRSGSCSLFLSLSPGLRSVGAPVGCSGWSRRGCSGWSRDAHVGLPGSRLVQYPVGLVQGPPGMRAVGLPRNVPSGYPCGCRYLCAAGPLCP